MTTVGDRCFFMADSHVGHDCRSATTSIFANNAMLGGHVQDRRSCLHRRATRRCISSSASARRHDRRRDRRRARRHSVRHWRSGRSRDLVGLNVVGMRRRKFSQRDPSRGAHGLRAVFRRRHVRGAHRRGRARIRRTTRSSARSWRSSAASAQASALPARRPPGDDRMTAIADDGAAIRRSRTARPACDHLRRRQPAFRGRRRGAARGRRVVLFALRGWADPQRVAALSASLGPARPVRPLLPLGAGRRLPRHGLHRQLVGRHRSGSSGPTWHAAACCRAILRLFRGGDDHLLSGVGRHLRGAGLSAGRRARGRARNPDAARRARPRRTRCGATAPISRAGWRCCDATGPFDIGQAVVVADSHVLAVEGGGGHRRDAGARRGTARARPHPLAARRRRAGQGAEARTGPPVRSALDRAADRRGRCARGTCRHRGVAGSTVVAEPERHRRAADRAGVFVVGVAPMTDPRLRQPEDAAGALKIFWSRPRNPATGSAAR